MIHEYALEPELVATWVDRRVGRYFIEKFGLGQPRIVSRYPKRWKRLVWEAFTSGNDVERARMTELLERLRETMVKRRDGRWDPSAAWLHNAEDEHARVPFHAILARSNPRGLTMVLVADEIDDATPLWGVPRGCTIPRTAMDMAAAVASMLRIADVLVFVDPHFGPENGRHRRPLERFLRSVVDARPGEAPRRLEAYQPCRQYTSLAGRATGKMPSMILCIPSCLYLIIRTFSEPQNLYAFKRRLSQNQAPAALRLQHRERVEDGGAPPGRGHRRLRDG